MVESLPLPPQESSIEHPSTGRQIRAAAIVALVSSVAACGLDAVQARPLGDEPVAMILFGCVLALVSGASRWGHPFYLGLAAMAGFPIWSAVDLALNGGHNLLPFEFAIYLIYAGIGVVVAAVARRWGN